MKKYVAFCSLLFSVIVLITIAGIALLGVLYMQWRQQAEIDTGEVPVVVEDLQDENGLNQALFVFDDVFNETDVLQPVEGLPEGQYLLVSDKEGVVYYVAWGSGAITAPEGVTEISTGDLEPGLERAWARVSAGEELFLAEALFLLR